MFCVFTGYLCHPHQPDPQMVPYVLWSATLGPETAGLAHNPASQTSSHPSCVSSWDILLYHNWLAQLSTGSDQVLAMFRMDDWKSNRSQTQVWWFQVVGKIGIIHWHFEAWRCSDHELLEFPKWWQILVTPADTFTGKVRLTTHSL